MRATRMKAATHARERHILYVCLYVYTYIYIYIFTCRYFLVTCYNNPIRPAKYIYILNTRIAEERTFRRHEYVRQSEDKKRKQEYFVTVSMRHIYICTYAVIRFHDDSRNVVSSMPVHNFIVCINDWLTRMQLGFF